MSDKKNQNIEESLKQLLFTGVGLASNAAEKLQETVNNLVQMGKLPSDEGKKIISDFLSQSLSKKDDYEKKLQESVGTALNKFKLVSRDEYSALEDKLMELEAKLAKLNKEKNQNK
jgi:polyhydroxyalkanoate synthesis regulator phasin